MAECKICGLTRAIDAAAAEAAGADFLGVIFAGGPRNLTPAQARVVLDGRVVPAVGVFANQSVDEIARIAQESGIRMVQLHGASDVERVEAVRAATGLEVWAVCRTATGVLDADAERLSIAADALVVDALVPGALGGTGTTLPWLALGEHLDSMEHEGRIVLAGGLTPENVDEAIDYVCPAIVDVSSGVESAPGIKDHDKLRAFLAAARQNGDLT